MQVGGTQQESLIRVTIKKKRKKEKKKAEGLRQNLTAALLSVYTEMMSVLIKTVHTQEGIYDMLRVAISRGNGHKLGISR